MSGQELTTFFIMPFAAFFIVVVAIPFLRRWAIDSGFVDQPGGRKQHEEPVPPIGGVVVFPVYMIVGLFAGMALEAYWSLFWALILLLSVGVMDDRYHINPWVKFISQFVAAGLIVVLGDARIDNLGDLFGYGTVWIGAISIIFCAVATVLLINAINLMDGLDGLAGGKSVVVLLWFMVVAATAGDIQALLGLTIMIGALAGFLFYNMRHPLQSRASVFLGDAGSMCLGLVVSWFALKMSASPWISLAPITVAWILGLPIFDACAQFYRRVREGRHPFSPDRGHFHHHFMNAGFSVQRATVTIMLIGVVMGGVGVLGVLVGVPEYMLAALWVALLFTHIALSYKPERYVTIIAKLSGAKRKTSHGVLEKSAEMEKAKRGSV